MTKNTHLLLALMSATLLLQVQQHAVPQIIKTAVSNAQHVILPSDISTVTLGAFFQAPNTIGRIFPVLLVSSFTGALIDGTFRRAGFKLATESIPLKTSSVTHYVAQQAISYAAGAIIGHGWRHQKTQKLLQAIQDQTAQAFRELQKIMPEGQVATTIIMAGAGAVALWVTHSNAS